MPQGKNDFTNTMNTLIVQEKTSSTTAAAFSKKVRGSSFNCGLNGCEQFCRCA
jgi:hypothetical protein